jgi:hypothetical protein
MSLWDWFHDCEAQWVEAGDAERLRLVDLHREAEPYQETDPATMLALYTEGRQLAHKLAEPWWVLFYDVWRVIALLCDLDDCQRGLELAVACAVEARKPQFAHHPRQLACFNELLIAYVAVDPVGYANEIAETLDFLDREIPAGANDHRQVMMSTRRDFLRALG